MYCNSPDGKLSQGDMFRNVKILVNITNRSGTDAKYGIANIIVITRNCEIDKHDTVLVARVIRFAGQTPQFQSKVRGDGDEAVVNAFYLPPDGQFIPEECYINWRTLQPVDRETLKQARYQQDHYLCTLDEKMRSDCLDSFNFFFTKPEEDEA